MREAKYLGVTLADEGVSDSKMMERIKKAKNVLGVLRRLGVFTSGVHPARSIRLYKSLVQSRWEYGIHLTPLTKKVLEEVKKVEHMFFGQMLAKVAKRSPARCRTMRRVLHPKIRRDVLARRFVRRLIRRREGKMELAGTRPTHARAPPGAPSPVKLRQTYPRDAFRRRTQI